MSDSKNPIPWGMIYSAVLAWLVVVIVLMYVFSKVFS